MGKSKKKNKYKAEKKAYALLAIPILIWCVFFLYAFFRTAYFSFTDLRVRISSISEVSFDQYKRLFSDEIFLIAIKNTFIWASVMTLANNLFGVLLAFLIFKLSKGRKVFLALLFWPSLISAVGSASMTKLLFDPQSTGFINSIIIQLGGSPLGWYNDPNLALFTLMIVPFLLGFSGQMIIYYVGLCGIPELYAEAAYLETNNDFLIFLKIYVPLLKNAFIYNLLLSLIGGLKIMSPMQLVSNQGLGGPLNSTMTIMLYIYRNAFAGGNNMGYASAIGIISSIFILAMSGLLMKVMGKKAVDYE